MESQLVSVIIPTYNRAEYLKETIESVLRQTYTHFELLILDNCSTDHTSEIIKQYNDPRIKYLRHESNIRGLANWSYGIYSAKGEYMCIVCDDDMITPQFLELRIAQFSSSAGIVSVFSSLSYWDEKKDMPSMTPVHPHTARVYEGTSALKIVLDKQIVVGSMYRTKAIQAVWEKTLVGGKTLDVLCGALLARQPGNKVVYLQGITDYIYRMHENQDSSENALEVAIDGDRMYRVLMEDAKGVEYSVVKNKLAEHWNRNGRQLWNKGQVELAKLCFIKEISTKWRILSILRLLRCYIPTFWPKYKL